MTSRRLLIVDDEPDFADLVRRVGERNAFVVEVLGDSQRFAEAYQRFDPTVIVLDVVMPEVDGIEIVRWLASQGNEVPVILTTGYNPHFAEAAKILGNIKGNFSITTLEKPVGLAVIEAALNAQCEATAPSDGTPVSRVSGSASP